MFGRKKHSIPSAQEALPGRAARLPVPEQHFVNAARLEPPFPDGMELGLFGLGCFWGAERKFWEAKGVYSTSVGYAGGSTPNPTYEEVCSGATGHTEACASSSIRASSATATSEDLLGESRPDARHAPGQ